MYLPHEESEHPSPFLAVINLLHVCSLHAIGGIGWFFKVNLNDATVFLIVYFAWHIYTDDSGLSDVDTQCLPELDDIIHKYVPMFVQGSCRALVISGRGKAGLALVTVPTGGYSCSEGRPEARRAMTPFL